MGLLDEIDAQQYKLKTRWRELLMAQDDPNFDIMNLEEGQEIFRLVQGLEEKREALRWNHWEDATEWEKGNIWGSYEDALVTLEATSGIRAGTCETVREIGLTQTSCCENCHIDGDFWVVRLPQGGVAIVCEEVALRGLKDIERERL